MATTLAAGEFLELLKGSTLLSDDQFALALERLQLADLESAEEAAKRLVQSRLITPFQSERLLSGRSRGFYIDRYKILEILGVGGMGCIYIAEDTDSEARVALKVLPARHEVDSGMLARFRLEANAGMRLKHPNVCRTLEMGDTGAINYFAMEFVKGVSLHELIVLSGAVPWKQCCDFFMQSALGLHHAHERGLIHRDVKPANLLIERDGGVRVVDFGLALLADTPEDEFSLQMIFGHDCLGTADFIAPEQSVNSSNIDRRADVYSLGCTMYLALTKKFPFPYPHTTQKLEAHRTKRAIAIRELNPEVPEAVEAIVQRMMRKRPEQRFASCAEVAEALQPYAERRPVQFDFQKILSMRIAENKLREQALRIGQSTTTRQSSSMHGGSSRQRLQAEADTVVGKDTVASRKSSVRNQPSTNAAEAAAALTSGQQLPGQIIDEVTARRVIVEQQTGRVIPLTGDVVSFGREPSNTVPVTDAGVSGKHCELRSEGNEWRLVDLGSKNGVLVNGKRVTSRRLMTGDRITVGQKARFQYRARVDGESGNSHARTGLWIVLSVVLIATASAAAWWFLR